MMGISVSAQQDKKAQKARKELEGAKQDLKEAKVDSAADFHRFKKEAELQISDNQKKIDELKAKKSDESQAVREEYDKKVAAVEVQNNDLKKRIKESNNTKTNMWTSFKRGFHNDMEALEKAIRDI